MTEKEAIQIGEKLLELSWGGIPGKIQKYVPYGHVQPVPWALFTDATLEEAFQAIGLCGFAKKFFSDSRNGSIILY